MSLRTRIILLFAATLVLTLGVASYFGNEVAAQALERALRDRTVDLTREVADDLALSQNTTPERAAELLTRVLRKYRSVRTAELFLRKGPELQLVHVSYGVEGVKTSISPAVSHSLPVEPSVALVEDADGRAWRADLPIRDSRRQFFGALRLETSLSESEQVGESERRVFFAVAGVGAVVLAIGFSIVLGRILVRPLSQLAASMATVESGPLELVQVPGTGRKDEIGVVARGLLAMLDRLRKFSADLQHMVEAAVADLARKNRELAEANRQLVDARRDLTSKERLAALGQLSGTIAHELGNPLNTISGHVQLLARDPVCPPELKPGLETVEREVRRMTDVIRRFLDSARALTPEPEMVELGALVDEVLSLSVPMDARNRVQVEREVAPEAARAVLDAGLVRHVLTNLVSNAVDAMPGGGRLHIAARRAGANLALSVEDSGPGIAPEHRMHIFEPFYTTKPEGKGSGLGLAICREIAAALHGAIEVESEPGRGATFTLVVPAPAA